MAGENGTGQFVTSKAIHLNNHAELSRFIEKMTVRCHSLSSAEDFAFYKIIEIELIRIAKEIGNRAKHDTTGGLPEDRRTFIH